MPMKFHRNPKRVSEYWVLLQKPSALFLVLFLSTFCSGCILTPFISSMHDMGVTKSARANLLKKDVRDFHLALQIADPVRAARYISRDEPEEDEETANRATVRRILDDMRRSKREEKIVDSDVDFIDLSEDGYSADVEVVVQYFQVPHYIVKRRAERERWEFTTRTGWQVVEREVLGDIEES